MGRNKKSEFDRVKDALIKKGVAIEEIENLTNTLQDDNAKLDALKPLCNEKKITYKSDLPSNKKIKKINNINETNPRLQKFFGKDIANLLIERNNLLGLIIDEKFNLERLTKTPLTELSEVERQSLLTYLKNNEIQKKLDDVNKKLISKGIKFVPPTKEEENEVKEEQN